MQIAIDAKCREAAEKVPELTDLQNFLEELLSSTQVEVISMIFTFYALFFPDINVGAVETQNNVSSDVARRPSLLCSCWSPLPQLIEP